MHARRRAGHAALFEQGIECTQEVQIQLHSGNSIPIKDAFKVN
jgi:hypothetical protein